MLHLLLAALQLGAACPPNAAGEKPFAVTGVVRDSATADRAKGAHVNVWSNRHPPSVVARTDASGTFSICVLRSEQPVHIYAEFQHRVSRSLVIPMADNADSADIFLNVTRGAVARIFGKAIESGNAHGVKGVQVALQDLGISQITDGNGRFLFSDVPPGSYRLATTHVAFQPHTDSLTVEPGALLDVTVPLATQVVAMAPILVRALSERLDRVGFYTRQKGANGAFITRADIQKIPNIRLPSDIVRNMRGVEVVRRPNGRGFRVVGRNMCPYRYFIDDVRIGTTFELDDMDWNSIEAIEIYNGMGQIPAQYAGTLSNDKNSCGVVVIWTRI